MQLLEKSLDIFPKSFLLRTFFLTNPNDNLKKQVMKIQKLPVRCVLRKRCSENMQQIYKRTPMPKCDFNKDAKQLY